MSKQRKKWEMDRRTFLRGTGKAAGVVLGLPLLEAMMPSIAKAAGPYPDANFVAFFKPLGIARQHFFPKQYQTGVRGTFTGTQWNLDGFSSQALAAHKDAISIFAGVGYSVRGADHEEEACRFLTGLSPLGGYANPKDVRLNPGAIPTQGKSMDQYIADHLFSADNPLRPAIHSMQLATDLTLSAPNHSNISFKDKDTPLPPTNDIGKVYDTLFFGYTGGTGTSLSDRDSRKRSILDDIWNSGTKSLISNLGVSDRNTVEAFLQSIYDVKKKIDALAGSTGPAACVKPAKPTNSRLSGTSVIAADLQRHYDIMTDLMIIALQCNRTRVISYLMEPSAGHEAARDWSFLIPKIPANAPEQASIQQMLRMVGYHEVSHYGSVTGISATAGLWANAVIDHFFLSQFAMFVGKLKTANLIDRTLVLFGSGFGNPEYHSSISIPCVTAGRALGAKTNQLRVHHPFYEYDVDAGPAHYKAAMSRLHVDIMQAFGVPGVTINNFGLRSGESLSDPARAVNFGLFA